MENKKISHVEIYFEDSSMERISNEEKEDKKLTKKQIEWIIEGSLNELNNYEKLFDAEKEVTINNYNEFNEDIFSGLPHSEYQMPISLLDALK